MKLDKTQDVLSCLIYARNVLALELTPIGSICLIYTWFDLDWLLLEALKLSSPLGDLKKKIQTLLFLLSDSFHENVPVQLSNCQIFEVFDLNHQDATIHNFVNFGWMSSKSHFMHFSPKYVNWSICGYLLMPNWNSIRNFRPIYTDKPMDGVAEMLIKIL